MKALAAILVVVVLALAAVGGYYWYRSNNPLGTAQMVDAQQEQAAASQTVIGGRKKKPANEADIIQNLDASIRMNSDTVAWLRIPSTDINDSVLQAMDNDFYLRRDEEKKDSTYGCYFADFECPIGAREAFAANTVIYGHSDLKDNRDGPRFSELFRFTELDFAQKTPYIYLTTSDEKTTWQIFAAFYTDTALNYIGVHLTPEQVTALAGEAKERSVYDYGVEISGQDKLLTLSTCSVKFGTDGDQRFVVMARLLEASAEEQEQITLKENSAQPKAGA